MLTAMFIAPLVGATAFYAITMGGKLAEIIQSEEGAGFMMFMLMMAFSHVMFFALIMLAITIVFAMPLYLALVKRRKDNWISVSVVGSLVGAAVGTIVLSKHPYGLALGALVGVITSAVFFVIARPGPGRSGRVHHRLRSFLQQ